MIRTLPRPSEVPHTAAPLVDWLDWLETIHPVSIDMGLDRVGRVADRLRLRPVAMPLILVGGTNGKGSTVAMLSAIYQAAGYRVGAYTSPHVVDFRERIRIDGAMADAQDVVDALAFVEAGRAPDTLTYFEYTTLAAMRLFLRSGCDVCLLEVGLGGRLDATNLWDADCSVVTSIALDHEDWLGSDIRFIATEKAAIGRPGKPLVVGDPEPPETLFAHAEEHHMILDHVGRQPVESLPVTNMPGEHQRRNAGCAVAAVNALQRLLPVDADTVRGALLTIDMMARFERGECDGVPVVLDVAHNPAGAAALCQAWQQEFGLARAEVIFTVLADKDLQGIVAALEPLVSSWHCLPLDGPRALPADTLPSELERISRQPVHRHDTAHAAWRAACAAAKAGQRRVLVTGSFHTVAAVHQFLRPLETVQ